MAKKTDAPMVPKKRKLELVAGDDLPTYYVNHIAIELSTFDIRFSLGQIQGATEAVLQVKDVARVFMSHSHFRALVSAINSSAKKLDAMPNAEPGPASDVAE
jgi:hypothetical protein